MSSPDVLSFSFHQKPPLPTITTAPVSLPSPPLSVSSDIPADAFDLDSLVDFASTPQSTTLVSPKTASALVSPTAFAFDSATAAAVAAAELLNQQQQQQQPQPFSPVANNTADALSKHHFERYLHYRALAAQAQAELALSLVDGQLMSSDEQSPASSNKDRNMLAALQPPLLSSANNNSSTGGGFWNSQIFSYQHQQQQVLQAQAQAHAHLQAAEVAQRMSMSNYYMPPAPPRPADGLPPMQPPPLWTRTSGTTSISGASPPLPSTPNYSSATANMGMSSTTPSFAPNTAASSSTKQQTASVGSNDMEEDELEAEDRLAKGAVPNMHGGGRGYVPGKTPDDPKKRHKCHVCGRGFARAFNLKSHVQTHDPLRPKPHQCPHPMCKRSFSRLHDLERHRQGIHSDGPLVDAKRQGVSPSVVRAQSRMQRRAETGGLI